MVMGVTTMFAQEMKTEKFKVYGNCGMCETRIEKAVTDIKGVESAEWDSKTGMIIVSFDEAKIKLADIHKAIAKVGHDTELEKADDKVYSELHSCCQYERSCDSKKAAKCCDSKKGKSKTSCGHKH